MRSPVPHRSASTVIALVPTVLLLGGAVALVRSWSDRLPGRIASHYDGSGPDRWSTPGSLLLLFAGIFGVLAVVGWLIALLLGRSSATRRMGVATAVGGAGFGAVLIVGIAWGALLPEGTTAAVGGASSDQLDLIITVAILAALACGVAAAALVPGDTPVAAHGRVTGPRMDLAAGERAMWSHRVVSTPALYIGGTAVLAAGVLAVALRTWGLALVPALLLVLLATSSVFQVTVDQRGLSVRSAAGWPKHLVPAGEIESVRVVDVRPIREFGGMGYRVGRDGTIAWALRAGEAIRVELAGGRAFLVTVDDAATGAALLTVMAERAQTRRAPRGC